MELKEGVTLAGIHLLMRPVLRVAEEIWTTAGRSEGVTITCAMGGVHSAGSWHYYGLALDLRTRYFSAPVKDSVVAKLKYRLPNYDVVVHSTHIHVEPSDRLAARHNLLINGDL